MRPSRALVALAGPGLAVLLLALLLAAAPGCMTMSHPPLSRADVETTDPGGNRTIAKARSPISALVTVVDSGVDATGMGSGWSRVGRASCRNILGLVAFGDATVEAAARSAGITTIHHVDAESVRVLFFYSQYTTVVYGD